MLNIVICIIVWGLSFFKTTSQIQGSYILLRPCAWLLLVLLLKWTYLILLLCLAWNQGPLSFALAFTWFFTNIFESSCLVHVPLNLFFKALSHSLINDVNNFPIQFYLFNIFCKYTNSNMTVEHTLTYNSVYVHSSFIFIHLNLILFSKSFFHLFV